MYFLFLLKKISPYFMTKLKVPDLRFFLFYGLKKKKLP